MTTSEQYKVQKIINWFALRELVDSQEKLKLITVEQKAVINSLGGDDTTLVKKWFREVSTNIIQKLGEELNK